MMYAQSNSLLSILILIGAAQGLFLSVALAVMPRGNRRANFFLSALVFMLALGLADGFLHVTGYFARCPHLIGIVWPANFLIGPFLFFYVKELTSPSGVAFTRIHFLHYLPAVLYALFLIPFYAASADAKAAFWASSMAAMKGFTIVSLYSAPLLAVFQKAAYYIAAFLSIYRYSSAIKQSFSSLERIGLSWLRSLLLLFFTLCFLFTFYSFCATPFGVYRQAGYLFYIASAVVTYVIAFKALIQPELFSRLEAVHRVEIMRTGQEMIPQPDAAPALPFDSSDANGKGKYQKSAISEQQARKIMNQLLKLMETERLFLEPELTLPELSERLSASPHHLSQVINKELGKSFFDFINEYRVREAQTILGSPESSRLSIIGIALDAGFNSKSAFYAAFSKHTGMTPSEFRKRQGWQAHPASSRMPGNA